MGQGQSNVSNSYQHNNKYYKNDESTINMTHHRVNSSVPSISTIHRVQNGGNKSIVSLLPERKRYNVDSESVAAHEGGNNIYSNNVYSNNFSEDNQSVNSEDFTYIKNMVYSDLNDLKLSGGGDAASNEYSETSASYQDGGSVTYSATSVTTQNGGGCGCSDSQQGGDDNHIYSATSMTQQDGNVYSATSVTQQDGGNVYSGTSVTQQDNNISEYPINGGSVNSEVSQIVTNESADINQFIEKLKQNGGNALWSEDDKTSENINFDGIINGGSIVSITSTSSSSSTSDTSDSSSNSSKITTPSNNKKAKKKVNSVSTDSLSDSSSSDDSSSSESSSLESSSNYGTTTSSPVGSNIPKIARAQKRNRNNKNFLDNTHNFTSSSNIFSSVSGKSEYLNSLKNRDRTS